MGFFSGLWKNLFDNGDDTAIDSRSGVTNVTDTTSSIASLKDLYNQGYGVASNAANNAAGQAGVQAKANAMANGGSKMTAALAGAKAASDAGQNTYNSQLNSAVNTAQSQNQLKSNILASNAQQDAAAKNTANESTVNRQNSNYSKNTAGGFFKSVGNSIASIFSKDGIFAEDGAYVESGVIPGKSYTGDKVPVQINSGEMVLNKDQQKVVADAMGTDKTGKSLFKIIDSQKEKQKFEDGGTVQDGYSKDKKYLTIEGKTYKIGDDGFGGGNTIIGDDGKRHYYSYDNNTRKWLIGDISKNQLKEDQKAEEKAKAQAEGKTGFKPLDYMADVYSKTKTPDQKLVEDISTAMSSKKDEKKEEPKEEPKAETTNNNNGPDLSTREGRIAAGKASDEDMEAAYESWKAGTYTPPGPQTLAYLKDMDAKKQAEAKSTETTETGKTDEDMETAQDQTAIEKKNQRIDEVISNLNFKVGNKEYQTVKRDENGNFVLELPSKSQFIKDQGHQGYTIAKNILNGLAALGACFGLPAIPAGKIMDKMSNYNDDELYEELKSVSDDYIKQLNEGQAQGYAKVTEARGQRAADVEASNDEDWKQGYLTIKELEGKGNLLSEKELDDYKQKLDKDMAAYVNGLDIEKQKIIMQLAIEGEVQKLANVMNFYANVDADTANEAGKNQMRASGSSHMSAKDWTSTATNIVSSIAGTATKALGMKNGGVVDKYKMPKMFK